MTYQLLVINDLQVYLTTLMLTLRQVIQTGLNQFPTVRLRLRLYR